MAGLQNSIDAAYKNASQRLFSVFFEKFKLLKHLTALKDYLLLGRGDFVDLLIEQLGCVLLHAVAVVARADALDSLRPSLSRPANTLYRHSLTATLDTAIRGSTSSTDDEEVLGRLDARMLEYEHGELGWDVFTLEYKVDAPVDVILDGRSMALYSKLFTHLWRIKRVEYALSEAWKRIMNEARFYGRVIGEGVG
jgi:gamma-tubulin complex component 3